MTELNPRLLADIQAELGDATLLAVSKKQSADKVRALFDLGVRDFGENYLQEALDKQAELADCDITWHFIGPIQSNKTRSIAESFSWVHSVDRLKIAERLNAQRPTDLEPLNICLQVNIDEEASKSGVALAELDDLIQACRKLPHLNLCGLMCIPRADQDPSAAFDKMHALKKQYGFESLSMGMSGDYLIAIEHGSTIVRIGTKLFGKRE